jgi:signal-transduction protein with cAMP-binding, CBS, and nucleotidyltransferase domain/DNA polymerase III epsilon subunit-like protein
LPAASPRSFTPLIGLPVVIVDTETTGLDVRKDRVLQIAALRAEGTTLEQDALDRLVNPGVAVPPASTAIHGLADADLAHAEPFAAIAPAFLDYAGDRVFVGHNIGFDLAILGFEAERHHLDWPVFRAVDVAVVARALNRALPDHGLDTIATWLGVPTPGRHTALGDVRITAAVWRQLVEKLATSDIRTLGEVERLVVARTEQVDGQVAAGWQPAAAPERAEAAVASLAPLDPYPFRHRLADVMSGPAVIVGPATPLQEAIERMAQRGISSLLVGEPDGRHVVGIVTERDVLRALAARPESIARSAVADVMSSPVESVARDEPLYRALGRMARLGIRHLAVRDDGDRVVGVVSTRDLLRQRLTETFILGEAIETAEDCRALADAWGRLPAAAERLLVEQLRATEIAGIVSTEIRAITARAADLAVSRMAESGMGPPPCDWCLFVLGSAGRGESLLAPDQDNALIYDGSPDHDGWFAAFSNHVADLLDAAGIVYCKGGVMARNEAWRHPPAAWRSLVADWLARARPEDLLNVDIFFDLRAVAGRARLAAELHDAALASASRSPAFLGLVGEQIAALRAPLGYFGGWQKQGDRVDLKLGGLMPITAAARLLALRFAYGERSTPDRLARAASEGHLPPGDARLLTRLHGELTEILLRQQIADLRAGIKPSSRVDVKTVLGREQDRTLRSRLGDHEDVLAGVRGLVGR